MILGVVFARSRLDSAPENEFLAYFHSLVHASIVPGAVKEAASRVIIHKIEVRVEPLND